MRQSLRALVRIVRTGFVGLRQRLHELPTQKATLRADSLEPKHTHHHTPSLTQTRNRPNHIEYRDTRLFSWLGIISHSTLWGSPWEPKCSLKRQSRKIVELGSHLFTIPIEKPLSKQQLTPPSHYHDCFPIIHVPPAKSNRRPRRPSQLSHLRLYNHATPKVTHANLSTLPFPFKPPPRSLKQPKTKAQTRNRPQKKHKKTPLTKANPPPPTSHHP